ncbi:inositol phosphate phosphatase SopB [Pseudomonas chlororaphis subsp. aurantiaca]|uniref:inositol phosphate phosphatase SopB n=1 Tax=Pseudomonas chlororaphis TaxID=587753 RepID=UPI0027DCA81F|nr:inositol phosphate phosphatase SopB [Pseudomonas chlororaphis]WMI97585.1 inositol phosphate phosphatase SopB [Pseudomonas chlororaphis subsp. aurantiaca]
MGALLDYRKMRHDAAAAVINSFGLRAEDSPLSALSAAKSLDTSFAQCSGEKDRAATKDELAETKQQEKNLRAWIAHELQLKRPGHALGDLIKEVEVALSKANQELLNSKDWNTVSTSFEYGGQDFTCTLIPASQMKLGAKDIFPNSYGGKGVCSASTCETEHAANLWTSQICVQEKGEDKVLFVGVRHGVLSPYGLHKSSPERSKGALNRATEVVVAALFAKPELLQEALGGEAVSLRLVSTSLMTCGLLGEEDMLNDQINAWRQLCAEPPLVLSLVDDKGEQREVRVKLDVAAFNFGVNELALKFKLGHTRADALNEVALRQLLGDDLAVGGTTDGWVGDYLRNGPTPESACRVILLSNQLRKIWAENAHNNDGGEPYKAAQRATLLAFEIGAVPCWNCKSGKDRTGMLDVELKREAVVLYRSGKPSIPGNLLSGDDQKLMRKALLSSGNQEVQAYNTGVPGSKVMKELPCMNLSYAQRIGDSTLSARARGLSGMV